MDNAKAPVLGTCFSFRHPRFFLTAAHCLLGIDTTDIVIAGEDRSKLSTAKQVILHPSADVAILESSRTDMDELSDFFRAIERPIMGMDYFAYGYPIVQEGNFSPRVFSGIFQTFHSHVSHLTMSDGKTRYRYLAGEISTACPHGLSGGPIFRPSNPEAVLALATENIEVGSELYYEERIKEDGERHHLQTNRVIMYGVALPLAEVQDWLFQHIPKA
jgi:hypothetical protein